MMHLLSKKTSVDLYANFQPKGIARYQFCQGSYKVAFFGRLISTLQKNLTLKKGRSIFREVNMKNETEIRRVSDLVPDPKNANRGTERGQAMLESSLRQHGAGRSILLDRVGRIIAGNKTAQKAAEIGIEDVEIVRTDGTRLVAAEQLSRICYAIDLLPACCAITLERLAGMELAPALAR